MEKIKRRIGYKISLSILCICIIFGLYIFYRVNDGEYYKYNIISTREIFKYSNESNDEYYIYFFRKDCKDCQKLQTDIFEYEENHIVYFINTRDKIRHNKIESFDWISFKTQNDIEIGKINEKKEIEYYSGESEKKYKEYKELNKFGKYKKYQIVVADDKYIEQNKNAKNGYVYASLLTPEIDNSNLNINDPTVTLPEVPTLFRINNKKIEAYYGVNEIQNYIFDDK